MSDDLSDFIKRRNAALTSMDRIALDALFIEVAGVIPSPDEVFWLAAHKARAACEHIAAPLRAESVAWLREHGSSELR